MSVTELGTSFLLTYLIHSTILILLAFLLDRGTRPEGGTAERLWRVAAFGGLLTAALQVGLGLPGAWTMREETPAAPAAMEAPGPALAAPVPGIAAIPAAAPVPPVLGITPGSLAAALLFLGIGLGTVHLAASHRRLQRSLRHRQDVSDVRLQRRLLHLRETTLTPFEVRLTSAATLPVPIAFGLRQAEICLPSRAIHELSHDEQEAMLAHELAHLVRRDPQWLLAHRLVGTLFFFQPLNALVRRKLAALAELGADHWAVETAGDPVALARCLTTVASWLPTRGRLAPVPAMATTRSDLRRRIDTLLHDGGLTRRPASLRSALAAGVVLAVVAAFAPGVSLADPPAPPATAEEDADTEPVLPPDPAAVEKPAEPARPASPASSANKPRRGGAPIPTAPRAPPPRRPAPPSSLLPLRVRHAHPA